MQKTIELVILLNGQFCPIRLKESQKGEFSETLINAVRDSAKDPLAYIELGDAVLISKNIVGWYFRDVPVNTSKEVMDLLKKNLPSEDGSEDWKDLE